MFASLGAAAIIEIDDRERVAAAATSDGKRAPGVP
jgi:hypothetical protein